MSMKKLEDAALKSWVDSLLPGRRVIGVMAKGDRFDFGPLSSAADLRLDYDVTLTPPKKYFLPERETLMTFDARKGYESVVDDQPFVLLGVHPYDAVAIAQMDAIFTKDNEDIHYLSRRRNATIVASDVQTVSANCFAGCMNTASTQSGFDVLLTKVGRFTVVDARTEKGEALMGSLHGAPDVDAALLAARERLWRENALRTRKHDLRCRPEDLPVLLERSYDHPVWEERAAQCYSCGSCNLVCPTCYCFDVQDDVDWSLQSGKRERKWDGCLLSGFALVAGNHNFRKKRAERYRHRYYRKGKYLWDRMGQIACVGCGRCITACTTKIANPVEIYNTLREGK